ncbi:MAG: hypothetical protein IJ192_03625 [Clostridia bacterium]|nr:hypothetical protein [Clostridia bacterium]MBR2175338.1 hypothetical protein [Clostridia bacterium]
MKQSVFNKTVKLIKVQTGYGRGGSTDVSSKKVRASVSIPGINLSMRAEMAERKIDLTVQLRRKDFISDSYTHVEYNSIRYRIDGANAGGKDMFVRLVLVRG